MESKRMGRPPKPKAEQASEIVAVRFTQDERALCELAAKRAEKRFSAWIRDMLLRAAKRAARQN